MRLTRSVESETEEVHHCVCVCVFKWGNPIKSSQLSGLSKAIDKISASPDNVYCPIKNNPQPQLLTSPEEVRAISWTEYPSLS